MHKIKLWSDLMSRQWSWYNDLPTLIAFIVVSLIMSVVFYFFLYFKDVMVYPSLFVITSTFFAVSYSSYNIGKLILMSILAGVIVLSIEDFKFKLFYNEIYNWRQDPKNHVKSPADHIRVN